MVAAQADRLLLRLDGATEDGLITPKEVVDRHLLRFAFREPPVIVWERA